MMSSHQIAAMASQQQAMFGNFASYAQQITPPYGAGPGMGAIRPPVMGGYHTGSPPMMQPPPPPMPGWNPGYGGGMGSMAMGAMMNPNAGFQGVMGEQMAGSFLGGLSTVGSGAARIAGYGTLAAGGLSMLGIGGVGMAALGGIPGMLGVGALEAGSYGAQQMYGGFQQQQSMNRVLRQRFGGMMGIGGGRGGTGFDAQEMGQIGSMVRGMANEDMYTSFDELTRLVDRTAQMGQFRGIHSARDFQTKFRQVVGNLREIAQVMNTSLEGATQFMEQMRNQGVFSGQDISATLARTRMAAGASGMSLDQIMAIRGQGTQMGRMMGMRGRQGANAMMNMATNIGVGMQTGAISDELIAEATGGLQGAEGAQAAAGMMMQTSTRWMQRGAGRALLAGLWDPSSGGISQERLQQALSGNLTFRQGLSLGRANVASTGGRGSEFFANIERIGGALQETGMGGVLQFSMLEQHIQRQRGVSADDPLGERFIRRQLGLDQNQFELLREMTRNMPRTLEERRMREAQGAETQARTASMEGRGLAGAQRRMQHWWEREVTNPLKQMGADLSTNMSTALEAAIGEMEGSVKTRISQRTKDLMVEYAATGKRPGGIRSYAEFQRDLAQLRMGTVVGESQFGSVGGRVLQGLGRAFMGTQSLGERLEGVNAFAGGRLSRGASQSEQVDYLNRFNEELRKSASEFGITSEQMGAPGQEGSLAERARSILIKEIGGGERGMAFQSQRSRFGAMTGVEKETFLRGRLELFRSDPVLRSAIERAGGSRAGRYAIAREIGAATGLEDLSLASEIGGMGGGRSYDELKSDLSRAKEAERQLASQLAEKMLGKDYGATWAVTKESTRVGGLFGVTWTGWGSGIFGGEVISAEKKIEGKNFLELRRRERDRRSSASSLRFGGASDESSLFDSRRAVLRRYSTSLTDAMSSDTVRDLLVRSVGEGKSADDALRELQNMVHSSQSDQSTAAGQGIKDMSGLRHVVNSLTLKEEGWADAIRSLSTAAGLQDEINLQTRNKELGSAFRRSLATNEAISEAALGVDPGAAGALQAIADAQSSGNWDRVNELRQKFFSDYVGKEGAERLAGALGADPSVLGTALGTGLGRAVRLRRELQGRGGVEVGLREALGGLGDEGLTVGGLGGKEFQKIGGMRGLMRKMRAGEVSAEQLASYFQDQGAVGRVGIGRFSEAMQPWLKAARDGYNEQEATELGIRSGASLTERGATAGAPETRQTLAQKQVDLLTQMVKLTTLANIDRLGLSEQEQQTLKNSLKLNVTVTAPGGNSVLAPEGQQGAGTVLED